MKRGPTKRRLLTPFGLLAILTFTIFIPLTVNIIQLGLHGFLTAFHILTRDILCCFSFHTVTLIVHQPCLKCIVFRFIML